MATEEEVADVAPAARKASKTGKALPTNRIGLQKQFEIIRAYGAHYANHGRPVKAQDVAALVGTHADTVRLSHPFLVDVGLMQKADGGLIPSPDVLSFHRAKEFNAPNAEHRLRNALRDSWCAQAITTKLSFKGSMDDSEAIALLADAANASQEHRVQLVMLLGYLETVGLIAREGNTILAVRASAEDPPPPPPPPPPPGGSSFENPRGEVVRLPVIQGTAMRTVDLPACKGTLTLSGSFNTFELSGDERKLVFQIIDKMNAFAAGESLDDGEKK